MLLFSNVNRRCYRRPSDSGRKTSSNRRQLQVARSPGYSACGLQLSGPVRPSSFILSGQLDRSPSMIEVIEINDIEELSQYRLLWNSLFPGTPNATFFLTFDWLDTYWRHFGRDQKLRVLIVYAAGEPIGILPLCVRTEVYRLSKVRVLTYLLDN